MRKATPDPRESETLWAVSKTAVRTILLVAVVLVSLEVGARVANRGNLPILPYKIVAGVPELPRNAVLDVRFSDSASVRYVTDNAGLRVHDSGPPDLEARQVFVAGDSQVLGYGFDFENTFAARVSDAVFGDPRGAVILGAPAMDPEVLARAVAGSRAALPRDLAIAVLALNLGNDLDEVFSAGAWYRGIDQPALQSWLICHSAAYMTYVQRQYAKRANQTLVPGINRVFYTSSPGERVLLVRETVDLMIRTMQEISAAQTFVVVIPQDIQVFPEEFEKYRTYFTQPEDPAAWVDSVPKLAREFGLLETYAASRLKRAGIEVVLLSELLPTEASPEVYFSRTSHHLLPAAHDLIAAEIIARAESDAARP